MEKIKQEIVDIPLESYISETRKQHGTPAEKGPSSLFFTEDAYNRPTKRRRLIPIVLVRSWADLQRRRRREEEKDFKMLKAMKNPKMKKKVKDMGLLPSTIRSRLKVIGLELFDIDLDKTLVDTLVPRIFLSSTYGGSPQEIFPQIGERFLALHGLDDWMYLVPDYHPDAPQVPGGPGMYLEHEEGGVWGKGTVRVFTRVQTSPNLWQYMGMYEVKPSTSLTKEEWAAQSSLVRNTWATRMATSEWGNEVCARVRARRELGREPSQKEFNDVLDSFKTGEIATSQEVETAYLEGKEVMGVWTMKCIGYDIEFQKNLCDKFRNWTQPPPREKKRKGRN